MELETILEVLPHRIASKFAGYGGALDLMLDYGTSLTRGQLASASDSIQTYLGVTAVEQPEIEADPEDAPEPEDAKPPQPSRDDLTPFLSDAAAPSLDADALDRAAIARAVAEKVRQVWPNHYQPGGSGSPFIVHLSGRWGSGKSSILSFLRDILQKEHREPWVVVHYNAWSKSQAGHAWWSMFNALIKQASPQLDPVRRIRLRLSDWWWRFRVGRQSLILTLLVLATLGLGLFALDQLRPAEPQASDYGPQPPIEDTVIVIEQVTPLEDGSGTRTETTTLTNEPPPEPDTGGLPQDFWALIALVGSGLTTLVAIINGVSFLRGRSAKTERTMHVLDGDHTGPMKDRFRKSIRVIGRPVAFCIDDLDRCDADYVVELLQVLQTVYAEVPVLYVIAADRDWLVSAYGQSYQAFDKDLKQPGQSLGDLFLEKIFQLSVTVPDLSPLDKERYIAALTGPSKAPPQRNEAQDAALRIEFGLAAPKGVDALREVTEKAVK
ncbi:MAG: P-loop NTPase fold protein, partial [Pseudomonadota bacterium]